MNRLGVSRACLKLLIAAAFLVLAISAAINSVANQLASRSPSLALSWRADDAIALTLREDQRAIEGQAPDLETARAALRSSPLTAAALRQIAVHKSLSGDELAARVLLNLAHDVTRREIGTSLLLIQDSLDRGDSRQVVRNFDEALTTSSAAQEMLYPALVSGLFDTELRRALADYIPKKRWWMPSFLLYAARDVHSKLFAIKLVIEAGGLPRGRPYEAASAELFNAILDEEAFGIARPYIQAIGLPQQVVSDASFANYTFDPKLGAFAWQLRSGATFMVERGPRGTLRAKFDAGDLTEIAVRVLALRPGSYKVRQSKEVVNQWNNVRVDLTLKCVAGDDSGRVLFHYIGVNGVRYDPEHNIIIPDDCSGQRFIIIAGPDRLGESAQFAMSGLYFER